MPKQEMNINGELKTNTTFGWVYLLSSLFVGMFSYVFISQLIIWLNNKQEKKEFAKRITNNYFTHFSAFRPVDDLFQN